MTELFILFNMALFLWTKCIRIDISRPPSRIGENLAVMLRKFQWLILPHGWNKIQILKFSRYMTNCDITDSAYSFDRNLATTWVGVNWHTVGFFQNFIGATTRFAKLFLGIHDMLGCQFQQWKCSWRSLKVQSCKLKKHW